MNIRKKLFIILAVCTFFIGSYVKVFAIMPHYSYNQVNVVISFIMKGTIAVIILTYIIFLAICLKRTKKDNVKRTKKLIIWLIIAIAVSVGLWFGAEKVFEAGRTYTSRPMLSPSLPVIKSK